MAAAPRRAHRCDERGAALVVTLVALLVMGGLLAAYLAVSALEPQISRNLADANATVIMRSTGTFDRVSKTVEVVVQRAALPPFAAALSIPATTLRAAVAAAAVDIDGRDYGCAGGGLSCDTESSWAVTSNPLKYGVSVGPDARAAIESALAAPSIGDGVKGKSRTDPAGDNATGLATV